MSRVDPPPHRASAAAAVLAKMNARLEQAVRPFAPFSERVTDLLDEASPFVEGAERALLEGTGREGLPWREVRSFVWLLAYRLGDQGWPADAAAIVVPAWRDASAHMVPAEVIEELQALVTEGYARGREDRVRAEVLRSLGEQLPVLEIAPRVLLAVAAGPIDGETARQLADRASRAMLRREARGMILDLEGLMAPTPGVIAELWAVPAAGRMLGIPVAVTGLRDTVLEAVGSAEVPDDGELRFGALADGAQAVLARAGSTVGARPSIGAFVRSFITGTAAGPRTS